MLQNKLEAYINSTLDPITNMELGLEYEKIGQGAAALSFFLRTAELTYKTNPLLAYTCVLKTWLQMYNTTRRPIWEMEQLFTAAAFQPQRAEAYYFLSKKFSDKDEHKEAYMYASIGLEFIDKEPLPYEINSYKSYKLYFQKAFSAWYCGQRKESSKIFDMLSNRRDIDVKDMELIKKNLLYV
tara:strand:- start:358 stop:906 length:549 start_codon:yes stop_codon:yes gene_type:complete